MHITDQRGALMENTFQIGVSIGDKIKQQADYLSVVDNSTPAIPII